MHVANFVNDWPIKSFSSRRSSALSSSRPQTQAGPLNQYHEFGRELEDVSHKSAAVGQFVNGGLIIILRALEHGIKVFNRLSRHPDALLGVQTLLTFTLLNLQIKSEWVLAALLMCFQSGDIAGGSLLIQVRRSLAHSMAWTGLLQWLLLSLCCETLLPLDFGVECLES